MAIQTGSVMKTSIDDLHERILIVYQKASRNDRGDFMEGEEALRAEVWAKVLPYGAKSESQGISRVSDISYKITIRYRADVLPDEEILWRGKRLQMTAPPYDAEARRIWLVMECREVVPDGESEALQE